MREQEHDTKNDMIVLLIISKNFHFPGVLQFVMLIIWPTAKVCRKWQKIIESSNIHLFFVYFFSSICWWVFSALVQTTRTLRLRRNLVKLALYRHFTNTLIFCVLSSVLFMLWSIKYHHLDECMIGKFKVIGNL